MAPTDNSQKIFAETISEKSEKSSESEDSNDSSKQPKLKYTFSPKMKKEKLIITDRNGKSASATQNQEEP